MSVEQVAQGVCNAVASQESAFVLANLAPPDMVGHTGDYSATLRAVQATDLAIGRIHAACLQNNYTLMITSDHGNAEKMSHEGGPHTAHTCAPVPLIVANCQRDDVAAKVVQCRTLCDVAPLVLSLLNLPIPAQMTGSNS